MTGERTPVRRIRCTTRPTLRNIVECLSIQYQHLEGPSLIKSHQIQTKNNPHWILHSKSMKKNHESSDSDKEQPLLDTSLKINEKIQLTIQVKPKRGEKSSIET